MQSSAPTNWVASPRPGGTPGRDTLIPGDSDRDGDFDSSDLVLVFQAGQYEDDIEQNSSWTTGDWNGDREFDSADIVCAFQYGAYEVAAQVTGRFDGHLSYRFSNFCNFDSFHADIFRRFFREVSGQTNFRFYYQQDCQYLPAWRNYVPHPDRNHS